MKWIASLLFLGLPLISSADERVVNGVVISCMKDGVRHYSTQIIQGCTDYKAINYHYIERILKPGEVALYRCQVAGGEPTYTSKAGPGCIYVSSYFETRQHQTPRRSAQPVNSSGNYSCTSDCSGHRAGHEWARNRGISDPAQCTGNSQSFIEGCRAFTEGHPGF